MGPEASPGGSPISADHGARQASAAKRAPAEVRRFEGVGFATPESVQHDPEHDWWVVSNIDGGPMDEDGKAFLSRIFPRDGKVEARWIDAAQEGVTLNAPKGIAFSGQHLYVADLTALRRFDRATGAPAGVVPIPGATFLNGVAAGPDGAVFVSDSGFGNEGGSFGPSGTDAVYRVAPDGTVAKVIAGEALGHPNGLAWRAPDLFLVTFGSGELLQIVAGEVASRAPVSGGKLDGLLALPSGDLLMSSWGAKAVLRGPAPGPFVPVATELRAPADIGFDVTRGLVLVPLFESDAVVAVPLASP